jgi:hypothetical protein
MTNYTVNILDYSNQPYRTTLNLKVKHFRNYDGRIPSTTGGHTAIFELNHGLVFSSKCREDEQFCRRKGILTCIQKLLQSECFQRAIPKDGNWIVDWKFTGNGVDIWIDNPNHYPSPEWMKWGWLTPSSNAHRHFQLNGETSNG